MSLQSDGGDGKQTTAGAERRKSTGFQPGPRRQSGRFGNLAIFSMFSATSSEVSSTSTASTAGAQEEQYLKLQRERNQDSPKTTATIKDAGNTPPPFRRMGSRRNSRRERPSDFRRAAAHVHGLPADGGEQKRKFVKEEGENNGELISDSCETISTADAGHTPKSKKIKRVSSGEVFALLQKGDAMITGIEGDREELHGEASSQPDDDEGSGINSRLRSSTRKLKRSMSLMVRGSGKTRAEETEPEDMKPLEANCGLDRNQKRRKSLGSAILSSIRRNKSGKGKRDKENDRKQNPSSEESRAVRKDTKPGSETSDPKKRSKGGSHMSQLELPEPEGRLGKTKSQKRRLSSFKLMSICTSSQQGSNDDSVEMVHSDESQSENSFERADIRRKSMGAGRLSPNQNRRTSSMYASHKTPAYMTCGFIMSDSPEERFAPGRYPPSVLYGYRGATGSVEQSGSSGGNRTNAGHTPLQPRKKHCSTEEKLLQ